MGDFIMRDMMTIESSYDQVSVHKKPFLFSYYKVKILIFN